MTEKTAELAVTTALIAVATAGAIYAFLKGQIDYQAFVAALAVLGGGHLAVSRTGK
jgi:hypothetical protein